MNIKKVAIIGAGVMGGGIAAQVVNSSHRVVLLDIPGEDNDKNSNIKAAIARMNEGKSPALTHPSRQEFIQIGNIEDNLELLSDCDLVIEAIVERIEIKHQLYAKIIPYLKNEAIIASNTSTLPLRDLKANLPDTIKPYFVITHFFNPPRTMELLELVTDNHTSLAIKECVTNFITHALGKTVIDCKDTPGFIANRLGCYLLELTVRKAIELGLKPNIIDQIFTDLFKLPSTGIFGLYDLIGLDVMQLISSSLISSLPQDDDYRHIYTKCSSLEQMINAGLIGKKTKAGFYKSIQQNNERISQIIDLDDFSYKFYSKEVLFKDIDELLESDNEYATFIKDVLLRFYTYILKSYAQITDNPENIDLAMKLGYSWNYGPFELLYNIPAIAKFIEDKIKDPIHKKIAQITKPEAKQINNKYIILSNAEAQLINSNNQLIFTPITKMNCLTIGVFELLNRSIHYAEQNNLALYILPPGNNFSSGADLKYILHLIENKNFADIDKFLKIGQQTLKALKYANIKIITGARGYALGGGTEILLHSHFLVLNQELKAGLVESAIGLVPAFGGTKEMLMRGRNNPKVLVKNIENIINANKSSSADYFIHDYSIDNYKLNMNRHYLLNEVIAAESKIEIKSEKMAGTLILPKIDLFSVLDVSKFNSLQKDIMSWLQNIIDTDNLTEDDLLDLERDKFIELCQLPGCQQTIKSKL